MPTRQPPHDLQPVPILQLASFHDPVVAELMAAVELELTTRYGEGGPSPVAAADFARPYSVVVLASLRGLAVGCAGLRLIRPGVGEIKRLYVDPAVRGRGVARRLLSALQDHARSTGLTRLQFETGTKQQPEAMTLYAGEGRQPIEAYGHHRPEPLSRRFALDL